MAGFDTQVIVAELHMRAQVVESKLQVVVRIVGAEEPHSQRVPSCRKSLVAHLSVLAVAICTGPRNPLGLLLQVLVGLEQQRQVSRHGPC